MPRKSRNKDLPAARPRVVISPQLPPDQIVKILQAQYSGPIPPSSEFAGYERVLDGAANRILTLAENASSTTQWIKKGELVLKFFGLGLGFVLTFATLLLGVWLIFAGKTIGGLGAVITAFLGIVGTIAFGRKKQKN